MGINLLPDPPADPSGNAVENTFKLVKFSGVDAAWKASLPFLVWVQDPGDATWSVSLWDLEFLLMPLMIIGAVPPSLGVLDTYFDIAFLAALLKALKDAGLQMVKYKTREQFVEAAKLVLRAVDIALYTFTGAHLIRCPACCCSRRQRAPSRGA